MLQAAYLGHVKGPAGRRGRGVELSLRPSALAAARAGGRARPAVEAGALAPGDKVVGWVSEVGPDCLWLSLGPAARGRVHMFDACDAPRQCADFQSRWKVGEAVAAAVVAVDAKRHQLDLSLKGAVAMRPHAAGAPPLPAEGQLLLGRVQAARGSGLLVALGWRALGVVALSDIHDRYVPNALAGVQEGAFVHARVLPGPPDARGRLRLSLRPSDGGAVEGLAPPAAPAAAASASGATAGAVGAPAPALLPAAALKEGAEVAGYVRHVSSKGLFVTLDRGRDARVKLSNMSDGFLEDPAAAFPEGALVRGRVIAAGAPPAAGDAQQQGQEQQQQQQQQRLELSLRAGGGAGGWRQLEDLKEGELTTGKVRRVERFGVFVDLARSNVTGLAHISQCGADGAPRVKDLSQRYQRGQVVRARVLAVDAAKRQVSLSLKPELVADESEDEEGEGQEGGAAEAQKGRRRDLDDEMVDAAGSDDDEDDEQDDGDDEEGASDDEAAAGNGGFDLDEMMDVDSASDDDDDEEDGSGIEEEEDGSEGGSGSGSEDEDGSGSGSSSGEDEDADEDGLGGLFGGANGAAAAGGGWGELALDVDADAADGADGAEGDAPAKLSKAAKRRLKAEREAAVAAAEAARAAGGAAAPQSEAEFERLVVGSPNSSYLWIRYMAFLISLGEHDRARAVAERALQAIHYREEAEKFNVWVAWLNLESAYGRPDPAEAAAALFKRALQFTDQKKLYLAMLGIQQRAGRPQLVDETLRAMTKRFSGSCKVWLRAIEHALEAGGGAPEAGAAGGDARKLLERALAALPRRKHVKAISRAALLEFRAGSAERGRSMMEGVLRNYPKRLDLWSVYIDQEAKHGDAARVRALLERATSLALPPKKMKFLFRRWLEYERAHGDEARVEAVKQKALEFVRAHAD